MHTDLSRQTTGFWVQVDEMADVVLGPPRCRQAADRVHLAYSPGLQAGFYTDLTLAMHVYLLCLTRLQTGPLASLVTIIPPPRTRDTA